ncbi:hypothetical protein B296_00047066 [Ensete ventricosum]|uniref:Uncharacterized protein n=1 Tax=Ensete ventricosum TaxID=4639 RepID=A0A426YTS8_ENSVE|nr:hypothetical protein B296_00047066 [Ensete ventricosum]
MLPLPTVVAHLHDLAAQLHPASPSTPTGTIENTPPLQSFVVFLLTPQQAALPLPVASIIPSNSRNRVLYTSFKLLSTLAWNQLLLRQLHRAAPSSHANGAIEDRLDYVADTISASVSLRHRLLQLAVITAVAVAVTATPLAIRSAHLDSTVNSILLTINSILLS